MAPALVGIPVFIPHAGMYIFIHFAPFPCFSLVISPLQALYSLVLKTCLHTPSFMEVPFYMEAVSLDRAEALVAKWKNKKGNLIMILHDIQDAFGYIPEEVARRISRLLDIPLARIYEVLTFYHYFKLNQPGKHKISVCMGTACYLKGSSEILEELKSILHIGDGATTSDGLFYIESVRCLGCCGLAPVMAVDGTIYGNLKKTDVVDIISRYSKEA